MGIFSSLIGAGASLLGGLFSNSSAKRSSREQMAFQERLSSTSYQRSMADMRKAGLNPILAYKQGGAGTPGGSSYTPANVGAAAVAGGTQAANSAVAVKRNVAELLNLAADTELKNDQSKVALAQANSAQATARNTNAQTLIAAEQLASAKATAQRARTDQQFWQTGPGKVLRAIDLIGTSLNPFTSATQNSARAARTFTPPPARGRTTITVPRSN